MCGLNAYLGFTFALRLEHEHNVISINCCCCRLTILAGLHCTSCIALPCGILALLEAAIGDFDIFEARRAHPELCLEPCYVPGTAGHAAQLGLLLPARLVS